GDSVRRWGRSSHNSKKTYRSGAEKQRNAEVLFSAFLPGSASLRLSLFFQFANPLYLRGMTRQALIEQIRQKQSYLCIGLYTDYSKIPKHLLQLADPVFEFNKQIIDATKDLCVSYKINTAFYESQGVKGWEAMEKTVNYIPATHFKIADAKRGDIGNTSSH